MLASFMNYFGGRKDPKAAARDSIVQLRQQLILLEKKEDHLQKKIDEEHKVAKSNAVSNKSVATMALKRKKAHENELERISGTRLQLEMQVNTLESANLNAETLAVMKKGADALRVIHGNLDADKVADTMDQITEQRGIAEEISNAIASNPLASPGEDEELLAELNGLEEEVLNERLAGADHVPLHIPANVPTGARQPMAAVEDDEETQLRELQAHLAM